jgi:hypothetical protein
MELRDKAPTKVIVAHRPMTKANAEEMGIEVDMVGQEFDSFNGVVNVLCLILKSSSSSLVQIYL